MAEGFARCYFGSYADIHSAGSQPAGYVAPNAMSVMREIGIDISNQFSKSLYEVPQGPYDIVVLMGCGDACPWIPATVRMEWNIEDPIGRDIDTYRRVRNTIGEKVKSLAAYILPPAENT